MYAFFSVAFFLIGLALVILVLVRKMPALAELPEEQPFPGFTVGGRLRARLARIDWKRYKRIIFSFLAAFLERLRRFFVRIARRSEKLVRGLRGRVVRLSGDENGSGKTSWFSTRIRKRSAYLEEERRLIEQLTADPDDVGAYRRLGNLYVIAGNVADARAAFTELLRHAPEDEEAQKRLLELEEHEKKEKGNT